MTNVKKGSSCYVHEALNHTSMWNYENENGNQHWLKECCTTAFKYYKIRRVKNKGALIVLLLSFLVTTTVFFFNNLRDLHYQDIVNTYVLYLWLIPFAISASLTGWIADTLTGRYAVIKISIWIIWFFMIISTSFAVVAQFTTTYYKDVITKRVLLVTLNALGFGLGGFHANIVQFGLDQLHDASTTEITAFVTWFGSTIFCSGFVVIISKIIAEHNSSLIIFLFIMCLFLTMAVLLLTCCNHLLIKEPPSKNPFRLIYNVIKFAIKNKHPLCRSAFTYCEDELPSRIDFGKSKYGGPFTTEQVEDVKTFLRLLTLIISFAVLTATLVGTASLYISLSVLHERHGHLQLTDHKRLLLYNIISFNGTVYFIVILLIVLNEFIIYPLFHTLCSLSGYHRIKSLSKIMFALILNLINLFILMALNLTSRHIYLFSNGYNSTLQCYLYESSGILYSAVGKEWFIIPNFLFVLSSLFYLIGIIEFLSSQSPYAMRGTIFGMLFATMCIIFLFPGVAVIAVFLQHFTFWSTKTVSCGFWYILIVIIIYSIALAVFLYLTKKYKMRKREDVLPNEQIFAERYYSQET